MHTTAQKEQFSLAYVHAIASAAGFALKSFSVDNDSTDIGIAARGLVGKVRSPQLDLQLKCTHTDDGSGGEFSFQIKRKNYDDLRHTEYHVPRLLVVLRVPPDVDNWLDHSQERLLVRHCAYWGSLYGAPALADPNQERVTVKISRAKLFNVDGLRDIIRCIGARENLNAG